MDMIYKILLDKLTQANQRQVAISDIVTLVLMSKKLTVNSAVEGKIYKDLQFCPNNILNTKTLCFLKVRKVFGWGKRTIIEEH